MPDAISPSDAAAPPGRTSGRIGLVLQAGEGGRQRVASLDQRAPLRLLVPRPEPGDLWTGILLNTGGGVVGGDRLRLGVALGAGAAGRLTTQAAEKVYRSAGPDATVETDLEVGPGAWLEWLPQETILFDRARLVRRMRVGLAEGARLLACEMLVFGRTARGETLRSGRLLDSWRIWRQRRLAWADELRLDGDLARPLAAPAGFAGAVGCATLLYAGPDAAALLAPVRGLLDDAAGRSGATLVGGVLLVRLLGPDAAALRRDVARLCGRLRAMAAGLPAAMPPLWLV